MALEYDIQTTDIRRERLHGDQSSMTLSPSAPKAGQRSCLDCCEQKNMRIGPVLPGNSRISAESTAGFILAPLEGPRLLPVLSYLVAAKREKLTRHPSCLLTYPQPISTVKCGDANSFAQCPSLFDLCAVE
jgi:hypothetical protein